MRGRERERVTELKRVQFGNGRCVKKFAHASHWMKAEKKLQHATCSNRVYISQSAKSTVNNLNGSTNQTASQVCTCTNIRSRSSFRTFACACVCIYLFIHIVFFILPDSGSVISCSLSMMTICMVHILKHTTNQLSIYYWSCYCRRCRRILSFMCLCQLSFLLPSYLLLAHQHCQY